MVGTVIKAGTTGKLMKGFERLALTDHMAEARAVVYAARDRATRTVAQARADAAKIHEEEREAGYQAGFTEGRIAGQATGRQEAYAKAKEEFHTQHERLASELAALISSFESLKCDLLEQTRRDLLVFALMVAERITKRAGVADRQMAVANAAEAIGRVGSWTDLVIRVHPSDLEAMGQYAQEVVRELTGKRHVRAVEEPSIEPGGCVVESAATRVDGTLGGQFNEVVQLLIGEEGIEGQSDGGAMGESAGDDDS